MSYTALYRKFRPETFEDVKGQEAIVTTLSNQIRSGRIGHAYLFCGTRGTGKTSVAKIMARAVNCQAPTEAGPCGVCPSCQAIQSGQSMNVIEIDAASNNGVDNVREIREEVAYAPTDGKYKVYIIDEVHMLSGSAFNALLKTLEEPPSYVIFILATTEPHKLPATILSRCQRYDFKRISLDTIVDRMRDLIGQEGVQAEEAALRLIARTADGSMRDALSLLDQCIAFYLNETLTAERVLEALGAVDSSVFGNLYMEILSGNVKGALQIIEEIVTRGRELTQFVNDCSWYLRNLLLLSTGGNDEAPDLPGMSGENLEQLRKEARKTDPGKLIRHIRILSELANELKYSAQKRILTEVAIIKMCRPQMETDIESLAQRIEELERKLEEAERTPRVIERIVQTPAGEADATPEEKPVLPEAIPEDVEEVVRNFRSLSEKMDPMWRSRLADCRLSLSRNGNLLIVFPSGDIGADFFRRRRAQLEEFISLQTGKQIHIEYEELKENKEFSSLFADLEETVKMKIEVEDQEE